MNWKWDNIKKGPVSTGIGVVMIVAAIVLYARGGETSFVLMLLGGGMYALGLKQ